MADHSYSVKINRRDGAVEITGPDKEWVANQLDKVTDVIAADVDDQEHDGSSDQGDDSSRTTRTRRRRTPARKRTTARSKGGRKPDSADELKDKLTGAMQTKLEKFVSERDALSRNQQDQAAIIATFVEDELKLPGIGAADLGAVYEVMGWRKPVNPRAAINNARERDKYFRGWANGKASLTARGQNFGRHDSTKKTEKQRNS